MESLFDLKGDNYVSFVILLLSIVGFIQGYLEMISKLLLYDVNFIEYITLHPEYFSRLFIIIYYIGLIFGALISCSISDSVGRRPTLLIFSAFLVSVLSWMTSSDSDIVVQITRFLIGVTLGVLNCTALVYIAEISPSHSRGQICALFPFLNLFGFCIAFLISQSTSNQQDGWRICIAFPVVPALIVLVSLVFVPESPLWLIAHKTPNDGRSALEKFRSINDAWFEFNNLYRALAYDARHDHTWRSLLFTDRSMKYRLGLMSIIQITRAYFGERIFYSNGYTLLHPIDNHPHQSELTIISSVLFFLSAFIGIFIGCINIDDIGRRSLILIGISMMLFFISIAYWINSFENLESYQLLRASFPLPFSIYFMKYLYFGFLCFFIVSYYLSFGTTSGIFPTEIFPLRARARGVSIIQAVYFTALLFYHLAENWMNEHEIHFTTSQLLINFIIFLIIIGCYLIFALPETLGIIFEDSDELFDIEEYDSCLICIPRGSGTGYLGFRTLSQTGARFEFYQVKKPSFNEVNSSNSTPNSTSKINFLPLSGSIMGSGGNPPSGDGSYYYEHKYSETMRQLNFQYVNDEEEPLHPAPLFGGSNNIISNNEDNSQQFTRTKNSLNILPNVPTGQFSDEKPPYTPYSGYSYLPIHPPITQRNTLILREHNRRYNTRSPLKDIYKGNSKDST